MLKTASSRCYLLAAIISFGEVSRIGARDRDAGTLIGRDDVAVGRHGPADLVIG